MTERGLLFRFYAGDFSTLNGALAELLEARLLRCTSPERLEFCDRAATRIFWQDEAEYYPCCEEHWPGGETFTGHTRFRPHRVEVCVIPEVAVPWWCAQGEPTESFYKMEPYERESPEDGAA